jgi:general L-amino acid transport system substrate-binding protein
LRNEISQGFRHCNDGCVWRASGIRADAQSGSRSRQLICGANGTLAGFGLPDPHGNWTGFDVDFCRAIAAAIFNDATKVKFVPLTSEPLYCPIAGA